MPTQSNDTVVSVEFEIAKRIEDQIETIAAASPQTLPDENHPLVEDYVRKIEGNYSVARSKADTDNAIDLLYIAYNTTPQEEGEIRVTISDLMGRLISAQQESELKMRGAVEDAGRILKSINDMFRDWREVQAGDDNADLKAFLSEDMVDLANDIKKKAQGVADELTTIAKTYDGIIDDTDTATRQAETALAGRINDKAALEKEINANQAQQAKLESLVSDLEESVKKYQKMADDYASRADTAEKRAFIMSIVRVGAQMLTAAIPAITAGVTAYATGGTSLLAGAAAEGGKQATNRDSASASDDNTADVIEKKKEVLDAKADQEAAETEKKALEENGKTLAEEKA